MQPLDPAAVYTDEEALAALAGTKGARVMTYRYDRLDELNTYLGPLDYVLEGSVANNALAEIKRTAKFTILDRGEINYLRDRIRPWARLAMPDGGFIEWPLGVFLLSTPRRILGDDDIVRREVEAYDQLLVLRDDAVADRYGFASGTAYTAAIATLVAGLGFVTAIIPSTLTMPTAMEWEPGTTRLRILNDLLAAINYESAWFDEQGKLVCRPYLAPSVRASEYDYRTDARSVITGQVGQTLDLFNVPNRWVLVRSEADLGPIVGSYTNTNPTSPTSTVSRGRTITAFYTEEDAADQTTIDAKAARYGFEASQVFENIEFETAAMPMHSNADVYTLAVDELGIDGKYSENSWELALETGARMRHTVRRVVSV